MKLIDKFIFCSISLFLFTNILLAQTPPAVQQDLMNFEPGELIVKLKDNVDAGITYAENGKAVSSFNIGELLSIEDKVASSKVMFHQKGIEASIANSEKMKAVYMAKGMTNPKDPLTMKNIFVLKTSDEQENILQLIQQIKDDPNVEYAEPNYIYGIDDFEVGEIITAEEASKMSTSNSMIDVNDPLYSSQNNIVQTNIDDVWEQYTTGDGSQIIAILDTGVDYTHPDLAANTWINEAELNGVEGYDDENGYIDDIRGWDFINIDNAPLDDNMHGTHVAGIAGAVGNNGIGIAGAAWNVKLMPIKVFQSTGQGNSTNIAAGVEYANSNGATIINMSFGSYAESSTLRLALENAYSTTLLVAAAGNDRICIGPGIGCAALYPGAYTYIFGIEDFVGTYDNYDQDGPTYSGYTELWNYELSAPGSSIMSTIPGGGYATLTGTSMATPLVAGALALYKEVKLEDSHELIFGNLISTSNPNMDVLSALNIIPQPDLRVINKITRDTINSQNGNTFLEPGETIEILPLVKNYWGPTDDVRVGIEFAEFEDTTKATIVQNEIQIGSISAYATLQDLYETLKITISEEVANNVDIRFNLRAWSGPEQEYMSEPTEIVINVKNAILLYGVYSEDMTLTADKEYLVTNNLIFMGNSILTINPGTTLKFSDQTSLNIQENSKMIANGTKDSIITLTSENNGWAGIKFPSQVRSELSFAKVKFISLYAGAGGTLFESESDNIDVEDVIFEDNTLYRFASGSPSNTGQPKAGFNRINIDENEFQFFVFWFRQSPSWYTTRFDDINITNTKTYGISNQFGIISFVSTTFETVSEMKINIFNSWHPNANETAYSFAATGNDIVQNVRAYPGTTSTDKINPLIWDAYNNPAVSAVIVRDYFSTIPYEGAHGIVWKVEVNGFDAQDEYALLDPLGVGSHEFKVYFNREMDTSVNPQVSYGVTIPYIQKIISETGTWSEDGKIYTVTHDVNIGAADGINRIRVQGAMDLDNFYIPIEDSRFNMLVQSAGSASAGWLATPGLGKIALTWEAPSAEEIDDALGYNMYRYQVDADGVESTPVKLNETLIVEDTDETTTGVYYSDFDVLEGETYFYKYKILRTSFEETDFSQTVSSAPLTSTLGDSNGDFSVNVMDLVQNVDYILGNNPTPFIFLAADVNADETINVLDIVGTVDIILNPLHDNDNTTSVSNSNIQYYPSNPIGDALFSWEGDDLYVESDHPIGGLQLAFGSDFEYLIAEDLATIEKLDYLQEDAKVIMLFSFNNTVIASGKTKLLTRLDASKELNIELAVVGTTGGSKLRAVFEDSNLDGINAPLQSENLEFLSMVPNPSDGQITLRYYLPEQMDGTVAKVYDMLGRLVHIQLLENTEGASTSQVQVSTLQAGNYIVLISAHKNGGTKHIANKTLIIK